MKKLTNSYRRKKKYFSSNPKVFFLKDSLSSYLDLNHYITNNESTSINHDRTTYYKEVINAPSFLKNVKFNDSFHILESYMFENNIFNSTHNTKLNTKSIRFNNNRNNYHFIVEKHNKNKLIIKQNNTNSSFVYFSSNNSFDPILLSLSKINNNLYCKEITLDKNIPIHDIGDFDNSLEINEITYSTTSFNSYINKLIVDSDPTCIALLQNNSISYIEESFFEYRPIANIDNLIINSDFFNIINCSYYYYKDSSLTSIISNYYLELLELHKLLNNNRKSKLNLIKLNLILSKINLSFEKKLKSYFF